MGNTELVLTHKATAAVMIFKGFKWKVFWTQALTHLQLPHNYQNPFLKSSEAYAHDKVATFNISSIFWSIFKRESATFILRVLNSVRENVTLFADDKAITSVLVGADRPVDVPK